MNEKKSNELWKLRKDWKLGKLFMISEEEVTFKEKTGTLMGMGGTFKTMEELSKEKCGLMFWFFLDFIEVLYVFFGNKPSHLNLKCSTQVSPVLKKESLKAMGWAQCSLNSEESTTQ